MCKDCDSLLGSLIERETPSLLMPNDAENIEEWKKLPIEYTDLHWIFDTSFWLGVYYYPECQQTIIKKFVLSIAWRALHSMSKDGCKLSSDFLSTERGQKIDNLVIDC